MIRMHTPPSWFGTIRTSFQVGSCSHALAKALDDAWQQPHPVEEKAVMPMAGGVMQQGYQCGLLWGAAQAAGTKAFARAGTGRTAETLAVRASQALVGEFTDRHTHTDCFSLTDTDWRVPKEMRKYMLKGGPVRCFNRAGTFAGQAFRVIDTSLDQPLEAVPDGPVSCAAEVVRRMGGTPEQQAMVAGFAGGLGLSGSGCGAVAAAIWMRGIQRQQDSGDPLDYTDPALLCIIDRFLADNDYELVCSALCGREFNTPAEHADFLAQGGCNERIDQLAAQDSSTP